MTNAVDDYQDFLEDGNHRWRKRLVLGVLILALIAIGVFVLFTMVLCRGSSTKTTVQTAKVTLGTITKTVSTSATAAAQSSASLSFGASGNITAVNVTVGQAAKQGDVLATIDATTLQDAVTRAQVSLNSAQTALNDLLNPPTATADEASADQSVIQAQQNLDKANQALQALYNPTSDQVSIRAAGGAFRPVRLDQGPAGAHGRRHELAELARRRRNRPPESQGRRAIRLGGA